MLDAIGDEWTPIGRITRRAQLLKKTLYPILETLVSEGLVEESREYGLDKGRSRAYRALAGVVSVSGAQSAMEIKAAVDRTLKDVKAGKYNMTQAAQAVSVPDSEQKLPELPDLNPLGPAADHGFEPTTESSGDNIVSFDFSALSERIPQATHGVSTSLREAFSQPHERQ